MIKKLLMIIYGLCLAINHFAAITVTSPSYGETIKAAEDFATAAFQDPWDMDKRTDLGWFIFDVVSGSKSNLTNISFSNGLFSASSSNQPQISVLETGSPATALLGKIGTNYKINANKYKIFAIRMKLTKSHDALFYWSRNTIYNGMSRSGIFKVYNGWAIYIINIPNLGAYAVPVTDPKITWSGNIDSLRFDPVPVAVDIKIDWIRLVENNSSLYRTVKWTGNSGNVDIYLDNDKNGGNGTLGFVAKNFSGNSYSLYVGALSPGTKYYVGVKNSSGGSLKYSSGYYQVNDIPCLEFTSPSEEGGEDFAETVLGNAWDMNALSDLDYYVNVSNLSITNIAAENLQGDNLVGLRVLKGTNTPVSGPHGDPVLYPLFWWGDGRGQTNPIDSDKYRILVLKTGLPGNWDLVGGSVARVIWKVSGDEGENVARSFIVRHKKPKVVMNTIIADMENLPLEPGASSPSHTGWNGMIEGFRIDPHEFSSAKNFYIQEIKLAAFERADDSYTFEWNYTDSPAENPTLKLFHDNNNSGFDGTLIKRGIDPISRQYTWNTSNIAEGTYYIYAVVSDGLNTNRTYARWPIVIDHTPSTPPTIKLSKTSLSFSATGSNSQAFTISNSGGGILNWTVTDNASWMSVSPASGQSSGTVTVTVNRSGLSAGTYTGTVTVTGSNATNSPQTVTVSLTISEGGGTAKIELSRSVLYFGASGSTSTNPQTFLIENSGTGTMYWSVSTNRSWLNRTPSSGSNSGMVSVSVNSSGLSKGTYNGTVTVSSSNATNSPQTIPVTLKVYKPGTTSRPFGQFATPEQGSTVRSSIPVTGWVLDDIGLDSVKIYNGSTYVGDAIFVEGARADVEQAYPGYPQNYQAGWGYMLLTYFLPNGGNGTYTLYAKATDKEGHRVTLGSKTIIIDNADAVKPFGAIDTPYQGGNASGSNFNNAGWVLTPLPNKVPVDGSTIEVYVDSVKLGTATYNIYRGDIASYFPGYANSNAAAAYFKIDTTTYSNGVHTIHWIVTDNAGNADGVGSRFFTILNLEARSSQTSVASNEFFRLPVDVDNSSPIRVIKGFNRDAIPFESYPDDNGILTIEINELQQLEIRLFPEDAGKQGGFAPLLGCTGYHLVGNQLRPLPIGSTFDPGRGIFYWNPAPGFVGNYELVFVDKGRNRLRRLNIKILPK